MGNLLCLVQVDQSTVAIKETFGKFDDVLEPGCHCVPWIFGSRLAGHLTLRVQQLDVKCETKTKDNVFVNVVASIQYRALSDKASDAFYKLSNTRAQIQAYVFDVIRASVPKLNLDDAFEQKNDIAKAVEDELEKAMSAYGFEIVQTLIVDGSVDCRRMNIYRLLNRLKASVCRAKGYREMDNHIPKEEDNDINWDTEDELEIQNIVPSSYSTLVTRNSEAIISNEELHLVLLHRIHFMDLQPPHVLIFPFPAQGHVNAMLKLTELLLPVGLHITFLISSKDYRSLCSYATIHSRLNSKPGFRFHVIEGLYEGNMDTGEKISLMVDSLAQVATPLLRKLILDFPVTCVIDDGINGFSLDAVEGTGIPVIFFRTISACAFWAYFSIPELVSSGELPFTGTNMDERIVSVKGMEGFLRRRDLPSFCRSDISNYTFQQVSSKTRQTVNAHALILNTFDDLEGPIVSQIQNHCTNIYTIGPLHAHLKSRSLSVSTSSNSFFKEDKTCIGWLDQQPPKSVLYVSFGSLATLTRDQLLEFWYGLVNSNKLFLWVIREDLVMSKDDENKIPFEVEKGTKERGYLVGWAPQEDVLAHPAVGAFLTHNGWNSTLESIVAGVPMVSWAFFADQQINSRFIDAVWKLGLDMKDTCDRTTVEKIVNEVMEIWKEEFIESANHMAKLAMKSVNKGGSSYSNLDRLIEDIKKMGLNNIN